MALKKEFKVWLHGARRMKFEKLKGKRDISTAALLREIIDFYLKNH
tara:strand:- start:588 stop:725 length:138 start_codon:yes stop_codon:yes gene_type:complete